MPRLTQTPPLPLSHPADILTLFGGRRTILPVIHVESPSQVVRNAEIAYRLGCNGVFLIGHGLGITSDYILKCCAYLKKELPNFWVGVNLLDHTPSAAFDVLAKEQKHGLNIEGLWADNGGIAERGALAAQEAHTNLQKFLDSGWNGLYFGGVAFKHQAPVKDVERAAKIARLYIDIITTSGDATGSPPTPQKIEQMARAAAPKCLAIASGITPENVRDYPLARIFLVSTGISDTFHEFNAQRLERLVEAVESMGRWEQPQPRELTDEASGETVVRS